MSTSADKIRKNVELNKPAAEVVWKLPPTAEQIQCCQSQRSDCGDVVSQARPDLMRICIRCKMTRVLLLMSFPAMLLLIANVIISLKMCSSCHPAPLLHPWACPADFLGPHPHHQARRPGCLQLLLQLDRLPAWQRGGRALVPARTLPPAKDSCSAFPHWSWTRWPLKEPAWRTWSRSDP